MYEYVEGEPIRATDAFGTSIVVKPPHGNLPNSVGPEQFVSAVLYGLKTLCPCNSYSSFEMNISGSGSYNNGTHIVAKSKKDAPKDCKCKHAAGCALVKEMLESEAVVNIAYTAGHSSFKPNSHDDRIGVIHWNSNKPGPDGGTSATSLAHESVHAWVQDMHTDDFPDRNGVYKDYSGKYVARVKVGEIYAVRGENEVRAELGVPLRTTIHSKEGHVTTVPFYDTPVIIVKDEPQK